MIVRTRFSPAPSGSLHVGSVHTALFNWLFSRHSQGLFALRIEDTDRERSRPEWTEAIQSTLEWLGLDVDDGPVRQSTRFDLYRAAADRLVEAGRAYGCFCTEAEVRERGDAAVAAGRPPGYDGRCRDLSVEARTAFEAEGRVPSIRFRTPDEGVSAFDDVVRGRVEVEWSTIPDFVIVRSGGAPLFFLANAVDDIDMEITHVIRGEDLLDSTHRVLALREALGHPERPTYAHLPLLVGADRGKLSKRHGAVAIEDFRERGYLPEALVNYLALLGWAPEDGREVLTREEMVELFELSRVTRAAGYFDHQKLDWMNGEHLRALDLDDLEVRIRPFVAERYGEVDPEILRGALRVGQERSVTLVALADQMDFLFVDEADFAIAPESWERLVATERVGEVLDVVAAYLAGCEWTPEAIDLRPVLEPLGVKSRKVLPAVYAAVEGRHAGLPLFDAIALLGRERSLARVQAARAALPAGV